MVAALQDKQKKLEEEKNNLNLTDGLDILLSPPLLMSLPTGTYTYTHHIPLARTQHSTAHCSPHTSHFTLHTAHSTQHTCTRRLCIPTLYTSFTIVHHLTTILDMRSAPAAQSLRRRGKDAVQAQVTSRKKVTRMPLQLRSYESSLLTSAAPHINYTLKESEIMEDLAAIQKVESAHRRVDPVSLLTMAPPDV